MLNRECERRDVGGTLIERYIHRTEALHVANLLSHSNVDYDNKVGSI